MPTITNQNIPKVHRKEWQMMTPFPLSTVAGSFTIADHRQRANMVLYVYSLTQHYLYHHDEDAWIQIPSGGFGGTLAAASCGVRSRWSTLFTATGGSTTHVTTSSVLSGLGMGQTIRFETGANAGLESTINGVELIPNGMSRYDFEELPFPVANNDTFVINTGKYYVLIGGTQSATTFKYYDPLLGTWTALSVTGLPASILTDAKMVVTPSSDIIATGTVSSSTTTVVTVTGKTWTVNQWTNSQIRISSGTGKGQIRTIVSNTANTLTISTAFTTTPTSTSTYEITGNDDFLYLLGNNAVTMYKYTISTNTWSTLAPTVARAAAPGLALSANWASNTGDPHFADENDIRDGRYIYSFRGGATVFLDRYDIALNKWENIPYIGPSETFTTGTSYAIDGRFIFIKKDATNRFFKFNIRSHYLEPLSTNLYPDGAALLGDRMWIHNYTENDVVKLTWLYSLRNTGSELHRLLLF